MDAFSEVFDHQSSFRIIVCMQCAIAVPPKHIVTHLREHHPRVSVACRSVIANAARQLSALAWEPRDLRLPEPDAQPIPGLVEYHNGLVCRSEACRYTCTSKQGIAEHCKKQHGWVNQQQRGGDAREKASQPPNRMWDEGQLCQRVFRAAGWPAYVAVKPRENRQHKVDDAYARFKAQRSRLEAEEAAAATHDTIREGRRQLPNPWLEMTGWAAHLKGCGRTGLLAARLPPKAAPKPPTRDERDADERALYRACSAARHVVRRAFQTCRPEVVGRPALELIERRESGAESNEKPFYSGHKASTVARYGEQIVAVLCYVWRTCGPRQSPPYELSFQQQRHMQHMKSYARQPGAASGKRLQSRFLRFWISLLDHSLPDNEHKNALISGIAVLGLKADHLGGGWAQAHHFSPVLSALITTSKALVVHDAYREYRAGQAESPEGPSVHELVKDRAERFMRLTGFQEMVSPMNRMLRLRTLAITFARQRNASGMVSWDGDKMLVDQQTFTMLDLQSMIQGLCNTARTRLLTDVLLLDVDDGGRVRAGSTALPALSLDKLTDQPAEAAAGYSFLKHPDNQFDQWHDWLLRRVTEEPALRRRFGVDSETWREKSVQAYMKGVRRFKEGLFALVHLSAGAPARGSEVTSILCENSDDGSSHRGVFIHEGLVAFVTTYHKGYSKSKRVKTIHRYVPREVGEIVVYFLALARPFIVDVQKVQCGVCGSTPFLWEPPPERQADAASDDETDGDDETDRDETERDETDSRSDSDHVGSDDSDTGEDSEVDKPRRSAPPNAPSANPDGYWGTDRVRRVLREYTLEFLGAALGTRLWRHSYPAIHRKLGTDELSRAVLDTLYFDKELIVDDTRARQSGHTLYTEESNYGRQLTDSPDETYMERNRFRRVSEEWHRLLRFASAWERAGIHHNELDAVTKKNQQLASQRWATLASVDLKASFQAFSNDPTAEFRSRQQDALEAICQRKLRVLVVMATGVGKSLLFMLPAALISGGYTIVIAPLNALRDNLVDRCEMASIPCAKWDGRRPPYWARVILVTPESAVSTSFSRFLDEKRTMRELDRIVVDECHILMESSDTWRPEVLKLVRMTEKDTQVVYLTATLPPTQQPHFLQLAGLDERSLTVCRDPSTARPNIAYSVVEHDRDALAQVLVQLVNKKRSQYGRDAQIIVYCPTREETRRLARLLQCTAFTSDMGTEEEKACRVRAFAHGAETLCTATNMLGLGLDAPGVRVVIHVAMCSSLEQYVQESGRAGRAGSPSEALLLVPCWRTKTGEAKRSLPSRLDEHSRAFLEATVCRRIVIDAYMDGAGDRQQCVVGEAACDLCAARCRGIKRPVELASQPDSSKSSAATDADRTRARQLESTVRLEQGRLDIQRRRVVESKAFALERLEHHLECWRRHCVVCKAARGVHEVHNMQSCTLGFTRAATYFATKLETKVSWQAFSCCPSCLVPQALCNRWAATDEVGAFRDRNDDSCQFKGVMLAAMGALIACQQPAFRKWMEPMLVQAKKPTSPFRFEYWAPLLGHKVKVGQRDATRMAEFLLAWGEGEVTPK